MYKQILILSAIFLFLSTTVFAGSAISDFNINNGATYATSTSVTLFYFMTADQNCTVCFSETNDNATCTNRVACTAGSTSSSFTLGSSNGNKPVYGFVYDNDVYASSTANDSITLDNTAPTASLSGVSDGNAYDTNTFPAITVTLSDSGAGLDKNTLAFSGSQTFSGNTLTLPGSGIADGNYTITIDANDLAGNTLHKVISFAVDTIAPSAGTITNAAWTNSDKPTFTLSATHSGGTSGLKMEFSCNNSSWTSWVAYATSYSDFNINNPTYGCTPSDTNKSIYVKFKDAAGNIEASSHQTSIRYETTAPSAPTDLSASAGNTKVTLTWSEPSDDADSGNRYIAVYKNGSVIKSDLNYGATSFDVNSLTNGTSYTFKLKTIDNAGNYSDFSNEVSATPEATTASITVKRGNETVTYAKNNDVLTVECTFSPSASNTKILMKFYNPSSSEDELSSSSSSVSSISEDYTVNTGTINYEKVGFRCTANASSGSSTTYVYIDNTAPTIAWDDTNNTFSGMRRIPITVSDNKLLDTIEFDFNNVKFNATKVSTGKYYLDLNTATYENGTYTLKVTATDAAGNEKVVSRNVTLENTQSAKQKAQKALADATAAKKIVTDLIAHYKSSGLTFPTDLNTKKVSADVLLTEGQTALAANDFVTAQTKGTTAKAAYDEINANGKIEVTQNKSSEFSSDGLLDALTKAGLSTSQAAEAQLLMNAAKPTRKVSIVKIGTDRYQAKIELTIKNDTNESRVRIVEIIPKEFAATATMLHASADFNILNNDPVIEFVLSIPKGQTATISYGAGEITKEAADKLIDTNIMTKFATAPIILKESTSVSSQLAGSIFTSPLMIGAIVLIILILIVVALVVRFKKPGEPFGQEKTLAEHVIPAPAEVKKEGPKWSKE